MTSAPRRRPRGRSTRPERSGAPARATRGAAGTARPTRVEPARPSGRAATRRSSAARPADGGRRWWRQPSDSGEQTSGAGGAGFGRSRLVRQIAFLGVVICVVATMVAYPLRSYLDQRAELAAAVSQQRAVERQAAELALHNEALDDPDYIAAEAKKRLQYVRPGVTVYSYRGPTVTEPGQSADQPPTIEQPWYSTLWDTLTPAETDNP